jgi:gliding motility-associated protein GldM
MAALNETPRQKMMGILYLVLLGLAATTVTDHVLDAFRNLTVSLETSTENVKSTVDHTFAAFEATNLKNDPVRSRPIYERAQKVKDICAALDNYIVHDRDTLYKMGGGTEDETGDVKNRADIDVAPRYMVRKGEAKNLKAKINETRKAIIEMLGSKDTVGLKLALNAQDPPRRKNTVQNSWEEDNFGEGIPLTAAITALTKIQADLKNTENEVVRKILGEANQVEVVMDAYSAVAIPKSTYVLVGQQYEAEVFLTAHSSSSNPDITVGGQKLNIKDGKGLYTVTASGSGERKWTGVVRIKTTDGQIKEYSTPEQSYTVAPPSSSVSPDKMNVFYVGVDNPVTITAPGLSNDRIHPSISAGGTISGTNGKYNVRVTTPGKVSINVAGEFEKGKNTNLGSTEFRVKRIPNPRLKFGGKESGNMSAGAVRVQTKLMAVLEDFEFEVTFNIQHFTMFIIQPRKDLQTFQTNSGQLSSEMIKALQGVVPGSKVFFDDVTGVGPDGVKRGLTSIFFNIN